MSKVKRKAEVAIKRPKRSRLATRLATVREREAEMGAGRAAGAELFENRRPVAEVVAGIRALARESGLALSDNEIVNVTRAGRK